MKLAVDIGNTTTTVGRPRDGYFEFVHKFPTKKFNAPEDLWQHWCQSIDLLTAREGIDLFLASVVPGLTELVKKREDEFNNLCILEYPWPETALEVVVDSPATVGADRIAAASAFYEEYGPGIVVDFGTATTVEAILPGGKYAGGVIMPGVEATFGGLFNKTAALPRITPELPREFKCDTTEDSLQCGIYYGLAGAVERAVEELNNKFKLPSDSAVVATGGRGAEFMTLTEVLTAYDEQLVLKGIMICCGSNFILDIEKK